MELRLEGNPIPIHVDDKTAETELGLLVGFTPWAGRDDAITVTWGGWLEGRDALGLHPLFVGHAGHIVTGRKVAR